MIDAETDPVGVSARTRAFANDGNELVLKTVTDTLTEPVATDQAPAPIDPNTITV